MLPDRGRRGGCFPEQRSGPVDVGVEQVRFGVQVECRVAPRAPLRLLGDREAGVGQHLLGPGRAHHRPQHRPCRVERRRAVEGNEVERGGVDERRPPLGLGDLSGVHRDPAGDDGERRVLLDRPVAECRQPAVHRRQLARLEARLNQLRHQLDAAVPLAGLQQVLDGHRRRPVGLVPVGGTQVQLGDHVGFDAAELTEQELPEQAVVAVPLPPTVERDQERAGRLEVAQPLLRARLADDRIAQRSTQLIEHRRAPQEPLLIFGQLHQRLAVQVVGHVPIVSGDRQPLAAVARQQRSEVQADRPALGPCGHRRRLLAAEVDVGLREDVLGAGRVEGQVAGEELQRVTRSPQPGQMGLLGTARGDQLRSSRNARDRDAQHIVTVRRLQLVKVVQHEHERSRARPKGGGEAWRRTSQRRDAQAAHVGDQVGLARRDPGVRRRQQREQEAGIIVEAVQ